MSPLYVDDGAFATYICVNEASYVSETLIRDLEGHTLYSVSKLVKIINGTVKKKVIQLFLQDPCILKFPTSSHVF